MKSLVFVLIFGAAACGGAPSSSTSTTPTQSIADDVGSLAVHNRSNYDIYSIQLSPYDATEWGANLLGDDPLKHGEEARVSVIECKKYDLRMIDDENIECIVQDIDLCFQDKQWTIDNAELGACGAGWSAPSIGRDGE